MIKGLTISDYLLKLKSLRNKYILPSAILCQLGVVDLLQQDPRHPGGQGGAGVQTQINPSEKLGSGDKRRSEEEGEIENKNQSLGFSGEAEHPGEQEDLCWSGWSCPSTCPGIILRLYILVAIIALVSSSSTDNEDYISLLPSLPCHYNHR